MADLPSRASGDAGHIADHNAIANWLNAQGYDEGQQILGHTGFPGGTAQFLREDGTWATPPSGGGGSAGFNSGMGHQYVRASGGSDANDGISPATAKATIQGAHNALPTNGGTIWLSEGTHTISTQTNISKRGVVLRGAGRTATRLKCGTAGIHMIHWTGHDGGCYDFSMTDGTGGDFGGTILGRGLSGIWLDDAQEMVMLNVRFDGFGLGAATGASFDNGPAALRIDTPVGFADWMWFFGLIFRKCYRGASITSGNNGHFVGCAFYSDGEERVRIEKGTATGGDSSSFQFVDCHFAGSGSANRWSVYLDGSGASSSRLGIGFTHCKFELSAATTGIGGVFVNGTEVFFEGTITSSGSIPTVRCGAAAGTVRFGQYTGPQPRLETVAGNTGAMRSWTPNDDSGTVASGAINTV